MLFVLSCSCLCPIYWSHVFSREWRCSWSSADTRCSNYTWVINYFIAYWDASYIIDLTVISLFVMSSLLLYLKALSYHSISIVAVLVVLTSSDIHVSCIIRWGNSGIHPNIPKMNGIWKTEEFPNIVIILDRISLNYTLTTMTMISISFNAMAPYITISWSFSLRQKPICCNVFEMKPSEDK